MEINIKSVVKSIQTIHAIIIISVIIFLAFSIYFNYTNTTLLNDKMITNTLLAFSIISSFAAVIIGHLFFKKQSSKLLKLDNLKRINEYKKLHIIRISLLNGSAYFALTNYLLTANYWFLVVSIIMLNIIAFYIPNKNKIAKETEIEFGKL